MLVRQPPLHRSSNSGAGVTKTKKRILMLLLIGAAAGCFVMLRGGNQAPVASTSPHNVQVVDSGAANSSNPDGNQVAEYQNSDSQNLSKSPDESTTDHSAAQNADQPKTRSATMDEVLALARAARDHLSTNLTDYTARFVKQEADSSGVIGPETIIDMKIQSRLRNETDDAPMRVYLKFSAPQNYNGREVLWCEDLHDGKMAVHEVGLILGFKTIWLDPNGMVAMTGQRYPISEIGIVRLCEKLIERGEKDRENPDVTATITRDHQINGVPAQLIQVHRKVSSGDPEEDFSLAEISIDPKRQLILQYRSFGWPEDDAESPPLQESYTYNNIKTNVGLTDTDFDYQNSSYNFP